MRRLKSYLLGVLIGWAWKFYGKPRLDKAVAENEQIPVGKKQVPVSAVAPLADAMPHIINGLKLGKTPDEIYADLKANLGSLTVNVIAAVLSILFPGLGTGIGALMKVLLFMHQHSVPMTQDEENAWFDRFGSGAES